MEKVLLLTLGTGDIGYGYEKEKDNYNSKEEYIMERIQKDKFPYRNTVYQIDILGNNKEEKKTEFIADILIEKYNPDITVIIGTATSGWSTFYAKFAKGNENISDGERLANIREYIYPIERDCGINTDIDELKEKEKILNHYISPLFSGKKVVVKLLRYGVNTEQQLQNYNIIKSIEDYFEEDKQYEVAIDITHAFRSLPVYNMIIFNYINNISKYDVKIKHIFYGNVDVKGENNNKAPVIDLKELVDVLDLTNGVSEFKNTGNSVSLLKQIPDEQKDLKEALEKFDWAVQLNSISDIVEALKILKQLIDENIKEKSSKYDDAFNMIYRVFQENTKGNLWDIINLYKHGAEQEEICFKESFDFARAQYILAQCYKSQNKYGQALATMLEALRSFMVPMYLEKSSKLKITWKNINDENNRKSSLQVLENIDINDTSEIAQCLKNINKYRKDAKKIRDAFAHNLSYKQNTSGKEKGQVIPYNKEVVDNFFAEMERLESYITSDTNSVYEIYKSKREKEKKTGKLRILISQSYTNESVKCCKGKDNDIDVYGIPNLKELKNTDKIQDICSYILEYIQKYFDISEGSSTEIVLDGDLAYKFNLYFNIVLNKEFEGKVCYIQDKKIDANNRIKKSPVFKGDILYEFPNASGKYKEWLEIEPEEL